MCVCVGGGGGGGGGRGGGGGGGCNYTAHPAMDMYNDFNVHCLLPIDYGVQTWVCDYGKESPPFNQSVSERMCMSATANL